MVLKSKYKWPLFFVLYLECLSDRWVITGLLQVQFLYQMKIPTKNPFKELSVLRLVLLLYTNLEWFIITKFCENNLNKLKKHLSIFTYFYLPTEYLQRDFLRWKEREKDILLLFKKLSPKKYYKIKINEQKPRK